MTRSTTARAARLISRVVRSQASVLFANSAFSAERFGLARDDPRRRVVYNPIDLATFDPALHQRPAARAGLGLALDGLVLRDRRADHPVEGSA